MGKRRAFTLIELLVVVAIIAILLAMLTPALDKAIEQAERTVCGTQLHLFGTAVSQYAMDNRRAILSTVAWRSSPTADPGTSYPHPLMVRPYTQPVPAEWNIQAMASYVGGVDQLDATRRAIKKPWYCPSNAANKDPANNNVSGNGELSGVTGDLYMDLDYTYFGQVGRWNKSHCTRPRDLVATQLASSRVLMADTLFYYSTADTWWLNHSANGSSVHDPAFGGAALRGRRQLDAILGINKLYGDASVDWKNPSEFNFDALDARDLSEPWISNAPNHDPASSITFY